MPIQPKALAAPTSGTTIINEALIQQVIAASRVVRRKRIILPLHKSPTAPLQRMLNGMQPFSYVRPHRHLQPPKPESIVVLRGAIVYLIFGPNGDVQTALTLAANTEQFGFDSEPEMYHTILALQPDTVLFEVKPGPFDPDSDKDFADWAPEEESPGVETYLTFLYSFAKRS